MASSLAETIQSDFLICGICLESYNDPRVLPCHHGFCCECLESCLATSKDKHSLICPTCRKVVKLSEGVKDLPVHFLVESLNDAVEINKMEKRPTPNTTCSICDDSNNKVTVRCMDCKQYLCDSCQASHTRFQAMRDHRVVPIEDILSGKVDILAEEKTMCTDHQEPNKFFCQDEDRVICQDCVILKTCPMEHDRITIDKAAQEKSEELNDLVKTSKEILKKYQDSVKEVIVLEKELEIHSELAKDALVRVEQEYIKLVRKTVERFKGDIDNIKVQRMKELERKKITLKSIIKEVEKANDDATHVIQSPHKIQVISSYATLSAKLKTVSKSVPRKVDKTLGYMKFETDIPSIIKIGQLLKNNKPGKPWQLIRQFSTSDFNELHGLALDQEDNIIAVSSWEKGVKVFTRNGEVKSTLYDSPGSVAVAVLPGKKYVTAPLGEMEIQICDSHGKQAKTNPITDMNNAPSNVNSLNVDFDNKIIVGQVANTISINNTDGSLISKFATQYKPYRLAAISNRDIVSSFYDTELKRGTSVQLMDYSGGNVRVIQPPDEVKVWSPSFICCGEGEIFVSNEGSGDPSGVYRYTSEGDYLGCVTTKVGSPQGITLSRDGMELFVADYSGHVKIFQRP